jgi:hypothetical protein
MKKVLLAVTVALVAASFAVAEADKAKDTAKDAKVAMGAKAAVKCIVCDKACEKAIEVKAGDQTLSVCCEACAEKVKANPDEFVKKAAEACKDKPAKSEVK